MKHFLIYTNKHKDQELATTKRIQNYLETKGCTVKLKVKESDWKEEADSVAEEEATDIPLDVDCMIVLDPRDIICRRAGRLWSPRRN